MVSYIFCILLATSLTCFGFAVDRTRNSGLELTLSHLPRTFSLTDKLAQTGAVLIQEKTLLPAQSSPGEQNISKVYQASQQIDNSRFWQYLWQKLALDFSNRSLAKVFLTTGREYSSINRQQNRQETFSRSPFLPTFRKKSYASVSSKPNRELKIQQASLLSLLPLLILAITLGLIIGLFVFWIFRRISPEDKELYLFEVEPEDDKQLELTYTENSSPKYSNLPKNQDRNQARNLSESERDSLVKNHLKTEIEKPLPIQPTTRLPKLDIVSELIKDLYQSDSTKRRKVIWELAQRADSRAIEPLVQLMIDTDSQERSLILAAISEITTRILRPMNQAFAISLEDQNPQVRKNAIRDITKVYELMSEITQRLSYLAEDEDVEVQETVQWALKQLNQSYAWNQLSQEQNLLNSRDNTDEDR